MMQAGDIKFEADKAMSVTIAQRPRPVLLQLSEDLKAADEILSSSYRKKISDFINSSAEWYALAVAAIENDFKRSSDVKLLQIHILSEQDEEFITFGLEFWTELDREHGRGMKVDGNALKIIEYGAADVSFC